MSNALHRRLLLLSNSSLTGCEYMGWVKEPITTFLSNSNVTEVLFIPFAGVNITWDSYAAKVQEALPNLKIQPIHKTKNFIEAVNNASAIMIGGGNTFHLLYKLYEHKLLDVIRERVLGPNKIPYIGWSAGSNVAGPDIGTTNDMPIIWPPSDRALNLVPYNLNPHYNEWTPPNLKAETRIDRLNECILIKKRTLVAISEGVGIKVENGRHQILAPKLPDEFLKLKPEERVVKLWTYQDGKPEIVNVDLNGELNSKLNISSISLQ
ncbi:hypothetical protein RDWZM_000525 [Blomia tropicalis]|uniref:Alpha-aspartyl dipeptidase n=1 Tax=Blomia tropicalis TaxID=40697 RepID=A0A9Q0RPV7_BLOTA|nr:hypothetical protein BLOT_012168 [Blomia tropicalis]KAJ6221980.1 hypothetical protein RDWZM_000525 [Blomia tropicalis]